MSKRTRFEKWEARQLEDPEFKAAVDELEPIYQLISLRVARGLTQGQLAALIGTRQSSISRLERSSTLPGITLIRRIVAALDGKLDISIKPREEVETVVADLFFSVADPEFQVPAETAARPRNIRDGSDPTEAYAVSENMASW